MIEDGLVPDLLLGNKYGHSIHFWDLAAGTHTQQVDLGAQHQMALELRPSHDPEATWGFVGVVISTEDLSASVFRWHRDDGQWRADKVITIPAEPADADLLPPALKPFGAVPPLITDIDLSVDDRFLYVSCWGTGELKQYDVSDPAQPREVDRCTWAGSSVVPRIPRPPTCHWPAAHRWSRSAETEAGVLHQLALRLVGRPVLPRRRRRLDGQARRRPRRRAEHGPAVLPPSATSSAADVCTRSACKAATPRPTHTATGNPQAEKTSSWTAWRMSAARPHVTAGSCVSYRLAAGCGMLVRSREEGATMLLVPRQLKRAGMTGDVPYYGGRFTPAQAYAASHPRRQPQSPTNRRRRRHRRRIPPRHPRRPPTTSWPPCNISSTPA